MKDHGHNDFFSYFTTLQKGHNETSCDDESSYQLIII